MRTLLIAAALTLLAGEAAAQSSAQVVTQGSATIMDPAAIAQGKELSVDDVTAPKAGSKTHTAKSGSFTLQGESGQTFNLAIPSSVKLVRQGGGEAIELTVKPSTATGTFKGAEGKIGSTQVGVGATAPVTSASKGGLYQGEIPVTLTYQ
jgi:hypothetical protein